ncbi:FeoB-associated Cys-rich membrane protein [Oleiharenicola lentus]|uniref:FeoB-associated Cys-rich membrane protein n=1 Tax=Oleiharenicola lentus TaxID=2508720 RepID=UPI003F66C032
MSSTLQTIIALAIVAVTVTVLLWSALKKRKQPGCGCGDACSAVTPEIKKLQSKRKS